MKKLVLLLLPVFFLLLQSCGGTLTNSITVKNSATNNVYLNIFGQLITVAPGQTQVIKNVQKGDYDYQTSFDVPSGVSGSSVEGNGTGTLTMAPSTKITIFFTSRIQSQQGGGGAGGEQSNYILIITISSSDKSSGESTSP
ncbi:MAG: hypothetical protein HRU80_03340 [Ignavibacteriales bacterium]|nr:hypothetical protein [Ignavibacteriaceae bacterium]QOJ27956.1 MAG: hypothetical protein HRU80_03340 [Ignavibacteriales bacterium]